MNASVIVELHVSHRTIFSECAVKQPLVSPITIGNVLCSGAAAPMPGRN
jgi:hypothetical protein